MKKLNKLNRITSFFSVFVLVLGLACSFSFNSYASSRSVPYAEPSTSDNQGYLIVELENISTGQRLFNTFFWYCRGIFTEADNVDINGVSPIVLGMELDINSNSIVFRTYPNITSTCAVLISAYWNDNTLSVVTEQRFNNYMNFTYSYASSYRIVGFNYKGNVKDISNSVSFNSTPTLNFSTSSDAVLLQQIVEELVSLRSQIMLDNDELKDILTSFYNDTLYMFRNYLVNASSKLNYIYDLLSQSFESLPDDTKDKFDEQGDLLNDLNEQNKLDKPTEDDIKDIIDNTVPEEEPEEPEEPVEEQVEFKDIVLFFTTSDFIVQALTIVFSMALVSYILFGKR